MKLRQSYCRQTFQCKQGKKNIYIYITIFALKLSADRALLAPCRIQTFFGFSKENPRSEFYEQLGVWGHCEPPSGSRVWAPKPVYRYQKLSGYGPVAMTKTHVRIEP